MCSIKNPKNLKCIKKKTTKKYRIKMFLSFTLLIMLAVIISGSLNVSTDSIIIDTQITFANADGEFPKDNSPNSLIMLEKNKPPHDKANVDMLLEYKGRFIYIGKTPVEKKLVLFEF